MPLLHLETLPHAGLPEWQHRQRCASISRFHELGGVLDFQQFAYTTAAANETERREYHLATANHTLHAVIAERNAQAMQRAARYQVPAPAPLAQHFSLQTDMGRKISATEFYGNQLDLQHSRLIVRGQGSQFGRYLYHHSETDAEHTIAREMPSSAFCHAFLNPPYPAHFGQTARETGEYFLDFCRQLFGSLDHIEAYAWNTDCSDYFTDGREWWGTYFWTVYSPQNRLYTGIMGSATD
ncbi:MULTISPECIES: hypothetical protein [unclassified Eikenella]|uniref:hypothetical protein n=1 Tax=unclassified Eikenella TaxID=2639367 RepID=UPI0008A54C7F|nr:MULTISPECIES: hypothetical protein [unclassified Eikenella]OFK85933.1 hypothetical protein HMPREF2796_07330 [Eikenella sp. HMSC071B05]OFO45347.1 hypothetical protein HMPREF3043_07005 [Eikenella sp. HMSC073A11]